MLYPFADYTKARLESALARADAADSALTTAFIEAGRGHERHSDIIAKSDELALRYIAASEFLHKLREEKARRVRFHGRMTPIPANYRQSFYAG